MPRFRNLSAVVSLLFVAAMCACGRQPGVAPLVATEHVFGIAGSDNLGASVAARADRVVLTWSATGDGHTDVFAAVSEDAGATFGAPVRVNDILGDAHVSGEQPPRVALGSRDIVIAWPSRAKDESRIRLARSTDGGRTFQAAVTLHSEALSGARGWESIAVDAHDDVHALWLDGRHATPSAGSHAHEHKDGAPMAAMPAPEQDIIQATLSASGVLTETEVASHVCFCCKTAMAIGPDQAVYAAWRHIYPNSMRDIAVAASTDHGRTFGAPARVSVDNWQLDGCPDDGPAMVVDASHVLHIVWPTLVQGTTEQKAIFYAFSVDGGHTFSPRVRLDDPTVGNASHPQIALDGRAVVAAWDEFSGPPRRVKVRRIDPPALGNVAPGLGPIVQTDDGAATAYPVVVTNRRGTLVAWTTGQGHTTIRIGRVAR